MKKLLLILLIVMCAQPVHAEELFDDKDMLLMEYMAMTAIWTMYVCDKPALDMEESNRREYLEHEIEFFINWLKRTYGNNWRTYARFYLETYKNNSKNHMQQVIEDTKFERSISLEDTLFCKHFLELDQKTTEMFKKQLNTFNK